MKKLLALIALLISLSANADRTTFTKEEVITPVNKNRIKNFLLLMKDADNRKLVGMEQGAITLREFQNDKSLMLDVGSNTYQVYWEDFNNDGKSEYMMVYLGSGSGQYSGVLAVFSKSGKKVIPMPFDKVVVSSLFPGKDMSRFHGFIANPFVLKINGKIFLRFKNKLSDDAAVTYKWEQDKFTKETLL